MLVISRRVGQRLVLPDLQVIVHVVAVRGKEVRIGVEAPRKIHVVREELLRQSQSAGADTCHPPLLPHD